MALVCPALALLGKRMLLDVAGQDYISLVHTLVVKLHTQSDWC